ncbi:hypothetical protein HY440_02645 [Candidatus Microgenomates bacterium]|nr:hypothetical protein [Candidatus Microgenomates bacterium]
MPWQIYLIIGIVFLILEPKPLFSSIGPMRATSVILSVILAAIFLKERNNLRNKLIGAMVTVVGVAVLL